MTQESKLPGEPHFNIPLSAKLFRLVTLKDGWGGEDTKRVTKAALKAIDSIVVMPTKDGGVKFELIVDFEHIGIEFNSGGEVSLWRTTTHRI